MSAAMSPNGFATIEALEDRMTQPSQALIDELATVDEIGRAHV